jgi:hypothetical protein
MNLLSRNFVAVLAVCTVGGCSWIDGMMNWADRTFPTQEDYKNDPYQGVHSNRRDLNYNAQTRAYPPQPSSAYNRPDEPNPFAPSGYVNQQYYVPDARNGYSAPPAPEPFGGSNPYQQPQAYGVPQGYQAQPPQGYQPQPYQQGYGHQQQQYQYQPAPVDNFPREYDGSVPERDYWDPAIPPSPLDGPMQY